MSKKDFSRLRKNRLLHFQLGMICSISFVLFAFNYSTDVDYVIEETIVELPIELTNVIPRTKDFKKPLPPPIKAPTEKIEIVDELPTEEPVVKVKPELFEIPIDRTVKFVEPIVEQPIEIKLEIPIYEEPVEEVKEPEIFNSANVSQMPRFPGCEEVEAEAKKCAERMMLKFIRDNLKYPSIARENGIQGRAVVRFIVDTDGSITNVEIVREVGGGCSKEAERVVKKMPKWIPGKQRNKTVKVRYNLPINFKLRQ